MPRKNYCLYDEAKAKSVLPLFLQDQLPIGSSKNKELADFLNCSVQAVNQYKQGTAFPKTENLIKMAQFFNCSLDYLIGLSDVQTPDAEIQAICEYTGLSESAIECLHYNNESLNKDNSYFKIVSDMLSNDDFYNSIAYLKRAKRVESMVSKDLNSNSEAYNILQSFAEALSDHEIMTNDKKQGVRLSPRQSIKFYIQEAVNCYNRLCGIIVNGGISNGKEI